MFIAALFIIAKKWKHSNVQKLMTDKPKVISPYNGTLLSHEKEWSTDMCYNWVNPENTVLSGRSQTQKTR